MSEHIWVVEYGAGAHWKPDSDNDEDFTIFFVRKDALEHMRINHTGHPNNLRVRKYVREER